MGNEIEGPPNKTRRRLVAALLGTITGFVINELIPASIKNLINQAFSSSPTPRPDAKDLEPATSRIENVTLVDFTSIAGFAEGLWHGWRVLFAPQLTVLAEKALGEKAIVDKTAFIGKVAGDLGISLSEALSRHPYDLLSDYLTLHKGDPDFENIVKQVVAIGIIEQFAGHGVVVTEAMQEAVATSNLRIKPYALSLTRFVEQAEFKASEDRKRFTFTFSIDPDALIQAISERVPEGSSKVLNLSFQFDVQLLVQEERMFSRTLFENYAQAEDPKSGETLYFEIPEGSAPQIVIESISGSDITRRRLIKVLDSQGNEIPLEELRSATIEEFFIYKPLFVYRLVDAYRRESAYEKLQPLIKMAEAFPEKAIVAAAGNVDDDLTEALRQLKKERKWLSNILLIGPGYTESDSAEFTPLGHVYGADVYVPGQSSSLGTGVVSASIGAIAKYMPDATTEELIEGFKTHCCHEVTYQYIPDAVTQSRTETTLLYDQTLFEQYIETLKQQ